MISANEPLQADYSELANSITDMFFAMDKNLRFTFWNKASESFAGVRASEAIGKSLYDIFPQSRGENSEQAYLEVLRTRHPKSILNVFESNGKIWHFEITVYPSGEGLSVFVKDISNRIFAQHALQESEARFRRIFDESPVGAAIVSLQFKFLRSNNALSTFLGYSIEELLRMGFLDITHPDEISKDKEWVEKLMTGQMEQFEKEERYVCKDGSVKWAYLSVRLIRDSGGKPLYVIPIIQDINDLKMVMSQLVSAKEEAEEANRRKSVFLASISHELRTPLNGILGFSELLMEEKDPDRIKKMAELVNRSGDRLLETLNLILDLSKLETGATIPKIQNIDITGIVEESLELFKAAASKKNLKLNLINKCQGLTIQSDRKIVSDIINNLINNALKFTHAGKISLNLDSKYINGQKWCIIEIADTGIGIAENNLALIFEEFQQVTEGVDSGIKGSGLGLSLCKKYTELLGGHIHVTSEVNVGSVFTVSIPV